MDEVTETPEESESVGKRAFFVVEEALLEVETGTGYVR